MIIIEQVPEAIDARQYIETNTGINVKYISDNIDNIDIDDILKYAVLKAYYDIGQWKENDWRKDK
jgi:hypothetical protein